MNWEIQLRRIPFFVFHEFKLQNNFIINFNNNTLRTKHAMSFPGTVLQFDFFQIN